MRKGMYLRRCLVMLIFLCGQLAFTSNIGLLLFTQMGYYGPEDLIYLIGKIENNTEEEIRDLSVKINMVKGDKVVREVQELYFDRVLKNSDKYFVASVETKGLGEGLYKFTGNVRISGTVVVRNEKEVIIEKWKVPEWVKRARLFWHGAWTSAPPYWRSVPQMKQEIGFFAERGATVVDNQCCQLYYNPASPSYPLVTDLTEVVDTCHRLGMKYIWYQTSCTASEYFIYQHRDWLRFPPFYTCSWLSFPPGCPKWSEHLGKDLGNLVSRAGIDGIMLDNSEAIPPARDNGGKEYYRNQYELIKEHLAVLRDEIKKKKEWGALIPNFGAFSPIGLKTCAPGWDGIIREGTYACSFKDAKGPAIALRDFLYIYSRIREITGKPVLPLCYPSTRYYANLSLGATIASRCTPGFGGADREYYWFIDRYQEYFYSPFLIPVPRERFSFTPDDEDIAVAVYEKVHQSGLNDYIVHILNAEDRDKEIKVILSLPYNLSKGYLISPQSVSPKEIVLFKDLEGKISFMVNPRPWSVVLLTSEIAPVIERVTPKVIEITQGEETSFQVEFTNLNNTLLKGNISFRIPKGISVNPVITELTLVPSETKKETFKISVCKEIEGSVKEIYIVIDYGKRKMEIPYEVVIKEPVEISVKPDHFAYTDKCSDVKVSLINNSKEKRDGYVEIKVPEKWSISPTSYIFKLDPMEKKDIVFKIELPEISLNGYFDVRDYPFKVEITTGGEKTQKEVPVRIHQPIVFTVTCNLGSPPQDIVTTGAGIAPISQFLFPVRGSEYESDIRGAIIKANEHLDKKENVVLWLRSGAKPFSSLSDKEIQKALEDYVNRGGGLLLQENIFSAARDNLKFLESFICPITQPYQTLNKEEGWKITNPNHPTMKVFYKDVMEGSTDIKAVKQRVVEVTPKEWAEVVATTVSGVPTIVVSMVPERKVGYIAGSLEGKYFYQREGYSAPSDQLTDITCLYIELIRWLGRPVVK